MMSRHIDFFYSEKILVEFQLGETYFKQMNYSLSLIERLYEYLSRVVCK